MTPRQPLRAYRLTHPESPAAPEGLWEWEEPYVHRLLWFAKTFGWTVVECTFLNLNAFAEANRRIWEAHYRFRAASAPWDTWQGWMAASRTQVATVHEVYAAQFGQQCDDP